MGKVTSGLTMSLDGFIAGPNDGPEHPLGEGGMRLFDWYSSGDTDFVVPSGEMTFEVSSEAAEMLRGVFSSIGAIVTGRRTFDITNGWGGKHPIGEHVPIFVVTHSVPDGWDYEGSPFTFVTDGVQSAVEQAREAAGEKNVAVGAASLVQQCLKAGSTGRDTCRCGSRAAGRRREVVRPPGDRTDRAGEDRADSRPGCDPHDLPGP